MTIKEKILQILGKNKTIPAVFIDKLSIGAVYTYRNNVFCLVNGQDIEFDDIESIKEQEKILDALENKRFVFNKSYQG